MGSADSKIPDLFGGDSLQRWQRNFLAVWPSLLAVSTGLMGVLPALPLYIEERFGITDPHSVQAWTAIVYGAAPLSAAICGPFWGALGDRTGRKAMAVRAQLGVALALLLMPVVDTPLGLSLLRVLQGAFAGYIAPAMALVTADVPPERHGRVLARLQLALALGVGVGPLLGAEITAHFDRGAVFWAGGGFGLVGAALLFLLATEDRAQLRAARPATAVRVRDVLANRAIAGVLLCILVLRIGLNMLEPFVALWVRELGALAALAPGDPALALDRTTGLAFAILCLGQFVATTTWGSLGDRYGPLRCLAAASLVLAALFAVTALARSIEVYLVLRSATALFLAGLMTLSYAAVSRRVDAAHKSLAFALAQSGIQLGIAVGPLVGSAMAPLTALRGLFVAAGAVVGLSALAMLALRRFERRSSAAARS